MQHPNAEGFFRFSPSLWRRGQRMTPVVERSIRRIGDAHPVIDIEAGALNLNPGVLGSYWPAVVIWVIGIEAGELEGFQDYAAVALAKEAVSKYSVFNDMADSKPRKPALI